MAVTTKTRWSQLKVGLMAMAALLILAVLIFLMSGIRPLFTSYSELYTYFDDSATVAEGSPVTLNGIQVGKVKRVELSGSSQPNRIVKVTMQVESKYLSAIPVDSQTGLSSANLLGTKFINIKKGKSPQPVMPGGELSSKESAALEDLFQQGGSTLAAAESILKRLDALVSEVELGKGNLGKIIQDDKLYNNLVDITTQFKQISVDLSATLNSSDNSVGKLLHDKGAVYDDVQATVARLSSIIKDVDDGKGSVGLLLKSDELHTKTNQFIDEARMTLTDTRKLLAGIQAGEGTLGKLVVKDDLHDQIQGTIARVDAILEKINNGPGVIGQLLNDATIAQDLDGVMRETQGLLKDFRANPKKFLHIKIGLF